MKQLENEINILAKCYHPNIIQLEACFEDQGYIYLIMELANEGNLFHMIRKLKKLSETQTAKYMKQIVSAFEYLHSMSPKILHRDIKPENVLIKNDQVKIADFGWSNLSDDFRNTYCGTPDYLSPEMILGSGHDEKLDIWTLGVLMFEMLSGRTPFEV